MLSVRSHVADTGEYASDQGRHDGDDDSEPLNFLKHALPVAHPYPLVSC